ncbi:IpaD/SipD/SspD family type III secretion system needle tip protein, partial [Shigella flexneri]|uniref:IpaD/SipD/SspD family type III secretion system needle tip protein n=1 Tax=Shigella flexneri TaxID=623 RepID=UPI0020966545
WNAGFSAEDETMKNNLQTLVQKYSNANSIFDNLVKVLSSTTSPFPPRLSKLFNILSIGVMFILTTYPPFF